MSAPTFEQLAREVLDSYAGAWTVKYCFDDGSTEQRRDLYAPNGMAAIVPVSTDGDGTTVQVASTTIGPDVDPVTGAALLRACIVRMLAAPRPVSRFSIEYIAVAQIPTPTAAATMPHTAIASVMSLTMVHEIFEKSKK